MSENTRSHNVEGEKRLDPSLCPDLPQELMGSILGRDQSNDTKFVEIHLMVFVSDTGENTTSWRGQNTVDNTVSIKIITSCAASEKNQKWFGIRVLPPETQNLNLHTVSLFCSCNKLH